MRHAILIFAVLVALPAFCDDLDAPFSKLDNLPDPTVSGFLYKLSLQAANAQGYIIQGRMNGVTTGANVLRFRGESPERVPGAASANFVALKRTINNGLIDLAATEQYVGSGMGEHPPDKPAASFRFELRHLVFINNEARLRIRFQGETRHFLLEYEDAKGLALRSLDAGGSTELVVGGNFAMLRESGDGKTWYCNPLTTWAMDSSGLLWSTDVQMEGQPKTMKPVGDLLFVTTTAGHSFYIRKDTGELAFYYKSLMAGVDPMKEVLTIAEESLVLGIPRRSLARFIYAGVILDDRRSIPFLIDCIEKGDTVPVKSMAIAALEWFNGNPEYWKPLDAETGTVNWQMTPWSRIKTNDLRQAETVHWRKVFAKELAK